MLPYPVNFRFQRQLARHSRFLCEGGSLSVSVCGACPDSIGVPSVLKSFTTLFLVRFLATNSILFLPLRTLCAFCRALSTCNPSGINSFRTLLQKPGVGTPPPSK